MGRDQSGHAIVEPEDDSRIRLGKTAAEGPLT